MPTTLIGASLVGVAMHDQRVVVPVVCAVVVAFYPAAEFEQRLRVLLPQVAALVVVHNTPEAVRQRRIVLPASLAGRVRLIENADNLGVGAGLNQGLAQAVQWGCDWLLTLDQDSLVLFRHG